MGGLLRGQNVSNVVVIDCDFAKGADYAPLWT